MFFLSVFTRLLVLLLLGVVVFNAFLPVLDSFASLSLMIREILDVIFDSLFRLDYILFDAFLLLDLFFERVDVGFNNVRRQFSLVVVCISRLLGVITLGELSGVIILIFDLRLDFIFNRRRTHRRLLLDDDNVFAYLFSKLFNLLRRDLLRSHAFVNILRLARIAFHGINAHVHTLLNLQKQLIRRLGELCELFIHAGANVGAHSLGLVRRKLNLGEGFIGVHQLLTHERTRLASIVIVVIFVAIRILFVFVILALVLL